MTDQTSPGVRGRTRLALLGAFLLGLIAAALFFRRQVSDLVEHAVPYVRRKATVKQPVLVINPWSGDGKAGDVRQHWAELAQIIEWIRDANGIAVLAHPLKYKLTRTRLKRLLADFIELEEELVNPYKGLRSFQEADAVNFFGRKALVEQLLTRFETKPEFGETPTDRFLAVVGPSGSGKSSVVLAGLIPALRRTRPDLQLAYLTPGGNPVAQLATSLAQLQPGLPGLRRPGAGPEPAEHRIRPGRAGPADRRHAVRPLRL